MMQARMLREDPGCADAILTDWEQLLPKMTAEYGFNKQELRKYFEQHRWPPFAALPAWLDRCSSQSTAHVDPSVSQATAAHHCWVAPLTHLTLQKVTGVI
jgi:hypothetical protein